MDGSERTLCMKGKSKGFILEDINPLNCSFKILDIALSDKLYLLMGIIRNKKSISKELEMYRWILMIISFE